MLDLIRLTRKNVFRAPPPGSTKLYDTQNVFYYNKYKDRPYLTMQIDYEVETPGMFFRLQESRANSKNSLYEFKVKKYYTFTDLLRLIGQLQIGRAHV